MVTGEAAWERGSVRRIATSIAVALVPFAVPASVDAAGQLVTGVTQPTVGVRFDDAGQVLSVGTMHATLTREMRGDTLVVTVTPIS